MPQERLGRRSGAGTPVPVLPRALECTGHRWGGATHSAFARAPASTDSYLT
jgi:hypothetical protein